MSQFNSDKQNQKHKIKKFLNLLKNAQNEVFVNLVTANLKTELESPNQRPEKLLKIVHFLNDNIGNCSDRIIKVREFSRLKITQSLCDMLATHFDPLTQKSNDEENYFERYIQQLVLDLNSEDQNTRQKLVKKIQKYETIIFEIEELRNDEKVSQRFRYSHIKDIIGQSKDGSSKISDLISKYYMLLRDSQLEHFDQNEPVASNQDFMKEINKVTGTQGVLSGLIEPEFYQQLLAPIQRPSQIDSKKLTPLSEFKELVNDKSHLEIVKNKKKNQGSTKEKYLVLSPSLSLLIHFGNMLTSDLWESRQAAACGLASILNAMSSQIGKTNSLQYKILSQEQTKGGCFKVHFSDSVQFDEILRSLLSQSIILMLKDQFCDYEDVNALTPVRSQGMLLIQRICEVSQMMSKSNLYQDVELLITNLLQLLVVCEEDWQAKQSFFMVIKAMIKGQKVLKDKIFEIFGKQMLIKCILLVEDSVKIVVTDLISLFLDKYFEQSEPYFYIDQILNNLAETLKKTDDIEASVIYVFNLINQILHLKQYSPQKSKFKMETDVFFAFNFHRVLKVRITFNALISKFLGIPSFFTKNQLFILHTLTVQSLIMESDEMLFKIQSNNLQMIILQLVHSGVNLQQQLKQYSPNVAPEKQLQSQYAEQYLSADLFLPDKMQRWLYSYDITEKDFENFLFIESPCFDSLENNYFKIAFKPVTTEEKQVFHIHKLERCIETIAIIGAYSGLQTLYISKFLKMDLKAGVLCQKDIIEYLVYEKIEKINPGSHATFNLLTKLDQQFEKNLEFGFNPEKTSVMDYRELKSFQRNLNNGQRKFLQVGNKDYSNVLGLIKEEIEQSQSMIKNFFVPNQQKPLDGVWLNIAKIEGLLSQIPKPQQESGLPVELENILQDIHSHFKELRENQKFLSDRFNALNICSHLILFNNKNSKVQLHKKLNVIIHPIWNQIRMEEEVYYQKVFSRILSQDLLLGLKKAGRDKPLDAVIDLIIKSVGKMHSVDTKDFKGLNHFIQDQLEEFPQQMRAGDQAENTDLNYLIELRGCELVIKEWIKMKPNDVLTVYDSEKFTKFMRVQIQDEEKLQQYVCVMFKIVQNLLLLRGQKAKDEKPGNIKSFQALMASIHQNQAFLTSPFIKFSSDLVVNLFYLLAVERDKCQKDAERKSFLKMQIELLMIIAAHSDQKSASAFLSLEYLLEQCLSSKSKKADQEDTDNSESRDLQKIIQSNSSEILKYLAVFLLPVIRNLQHSAQVFGEGFQNKSMKILSLLIQLLPSFQQSNDPLMLKILGEQLKQGQEFLSVFTQSNIKPQNYELIIKPNADLRDYQKQGIQWMAKLGNYGLNSALCDDMGLGKTIQSLTVIINESHIKKARTQQRPVNIVICPNTLTYQWQKEIEKFFAHANITAAVYESKSSQQIEYLLNEGQLDIIITSYERARNDIDFLSQIDFFYAVLDEGHKIKNAKSKTTKAIKTLNAERKLVLSGTPLQNRVSELWSIFDFLMPNFLEEEGVFNKLYNQFLTSNLSKLQEKPEETENFIKALKSLKKRIAPFILRRTKTEVLKDLPPKVIQDFECKMPEFQQEVYDYVDKHFPIQQVTQGTDGQQGQAQRQRGSTILENLTIHRKACNHPSMIKDRLPKDLQTQLKSQMKNREDFIKISGKMLGLVDLLKQSKIIQEGGAEQNEETYTQAKPKRRNQAHESAGGNSYEGMFSMSIELDDEGNEAQKYLQDTNSGPHRALIFCQYKDYMEQIKEKILIPYGIKYAELQSSYSGEQRFNAVENYNSDTSISVMIMTTAVGGLGLNLTGADTVIFMEHDWNPMKDMQAIDRAHRIGQKRVVNVYRLILMDSLEQKIMSLQGFKKKLASNLIQSQSANISTQDAEKMDVHGLLTAFEGHTTYENTTQNKVNVNSNNVGAESLQDRVVDDQFNSIPVWLQDMENE